MELHKIEILIEKYFEAETSIAEEKLLRDYFASSDVAQHLERYRPMFSYFSEAREVVSEQKMAGPRRQFRWVSVAASVAVLLGVGTFAYINTTQSNAELGTYSDPEQAFRQTHQALELLSTQVNKGVESVQYIEEFDAAKERIFVSEQFKKNKN